ncbi:hypothetical protein EV363DRAFT_307083 [Boletus edulis]|nr:hypothetical protein EV363DRAFT_307083 [Boletus edulis]
MENAHKLCTPEPSMIVIETAKQTSEFHIVCLSLKVHLPRLAYFSIVAPFSRLVWFLSCIDIPATTQVRLSRVSGRNPLECEQSRAIQRIPLGDSVIPRTRKRPPQIFVQWSCKARVGACPSPLAPPSMIVVTRWTSWAATRTAIAIFRLKRTSYRNSERSPGMMWWLVSAATWHWHIWTTSSWVAIMGASTISLGTSASCKTRNCTMTPSSHFWRMRTGRRISTPGTGGLVVRNRSCSVDKRNCSENESLLSEACTSTSVDSGIFVTELPCRGRRKHDHGISMCIYITDGPVQL